MKTIVYLILLLTCHQLWADLPIVSIYEHVNAGYTDYGDSVSENYFYLELDDTGNYGPDTALGGAAARTIRVNLTFTYTFVNNRGQQRIVEVHWPRYSRYLRGRVTVNRLLWRRPTSSQMEILTREGFFASSNEPGVVVTVEPSQTVTSRYQIAPDYRTFQDGPFRDRDYFGSLDPDRNPFDDDFGHFYTSWLTWYNFLNDDNWNFGQGHDWQGNGSVRRHLERTNHKITKFSIREGTLKGRMQKTLISFDTRMFPRGVTMEHYFRLVYEYTYAHRVTGKPKKIIMTRMVNALIPTGMNKVQGTVNAPFPPWLYRWKAYTSLYELYKIKVTLESPHMLPVNQSSSYYYDGRYNNNTDWNNADDHYAHTWDQVCTGPHDFTSYTNTTTNGLTLDPWAESVRSQDLF